MNLFLESALLCISKLTALAVSPIFTTIVYLIIYLYTLTYTTFHNFFLNDIDISLLWRLFRALVFHTAYPLRIQDPVFSNRSRENAMVVQIKN